MSSTVDQLMQSATLARREHRHAEAERDLIEAVSMARTNGSRGDLAKALTGLGQIERDLNRMDASLQHYEEALGLLRAEGDALKIAHTVRHVGDIHQDAGRRELAEPCYAEALRLYRGDPRTRPLDLANAIRGLALLKDNAGEADEARLLWQQARELYAAVNVEAGVAESTRRLARLG
jgi:tetratricopeptide (TPR) repeat protein